MNSEKENNKVVHSSFWSNIFNSPTEKTDLEKSLQSLPLFNSLSKKDLNLLMKISHIRSYVSDEYIFYQGDPGIGLYIIRSGEVQIERETESGRKINLATFGKGDFFGELALVDGEKRSASAIAKSDTRLSVLFKPDLDEFVERYPKKGINILDGIAVIIAMRLRKLNEDYFYLLNKQFKEAEEINNGT
jgi:CRP-like cAMP-binding protein